MIVAFLGSKGRCGGNEGRYGTASAAVIQTNRGRTRSCRSGEVRRLGGHPRGSIAGNKGGRVGRGLRTKEGPYVCNGHRQAQ